ncbi:MAG: MBL fold metallo-hydrolase [Bacteroidetes bacterium]|nr:MBL fold metallo-hydrolase [Bacteroidota bacterium]MBU1116017.1 MBL fold metallo-hydrolase [Bacteroidota bacterium]MBU1799215.1 MBL fold metallo-hydrolase [Bacteroidota bacterium]
MEVTFVGTGSGKTQLKRFHTSLLISSKNHSLLIDTGDGISKALLSLEIDLNKIDSIFITHTHSDHFSGIASLLTQMKMAERTKPLYFYIHSSFVNFANNFLFSSFLFPETFNFLFKIIGYNFGQKILFDENFGILPLQNTHITNKHNVKLIPKNNFVSASILIMDAEISIHYTSDIGSIADLSLFNEFFPKYLIVESTHVSFYHIINYLENSFVEKVYLVHINDNDGIVDKHSKLSYKLKNKIFITYDGMKVYPTI